jgi:chromosome segregation ATPase
MTHVDLFDQLQRLQIENAALQERISSLKQQGGETDTASDDSENESYASEIASIKERITAEQQETSDLKRELSQLIRTQEEFQRRIEAENSLVATTLVPLLKSEEQLTQEFYSSLLSKCQAVEGIDFAALKALVDGVQLKRKALSDATDENQKIHRLIVLSRAQNADRPILAPALALPKQQPVDGQRRLSGTMSLGAIDVAAPARTEARGAQTAQARGPRRRVTFKPKEAGEKE